MSGLNRKVIELKNRKKAVILAHNYQRPEIQDVADYVGDSFGLAQQAKKTESRMIVFCGVDFMAETVAILNPDRKVLNSEPNATCPMAQMLSPKELQLAKKKFPDADVVLYINTNVDVKAECDCICTSANAVEVVNAMDADKILFGPDKNLAYYVQRRTRKTIIPVPEYGLCPTHHLISEWDIVEAKEKHPKAKIVVHPETIPEVQELADHIASTEGMINYCKKSKEMEFIIGTENGIIHRLKKDVPGKKFYPASDSAICPNMKMNTLEKVFDALDKEQYKVEVPRDTAKRARIVIERMLSIT